MFHPYKLSGFLLFFSVAFFLISCVKEEAVVENETESNTNSGISELNLDVEIENGMLHFDDFDAFQSAMEFISDSEEKFFTDDALYEWEARLGFRSMRQKMEDVRDELVTVSDEHSLAAFRAEHGVFLDREEELRLPVGNEILASLIDERGRVLIGNVLHCFTDKHQIIVLDRNENKLETALRSLETDEGAGVYVFNYIYEDVQYRGDCGQERNCEDKSDGNSNGSKRVKGKWQLQLYASPQWNSSCLCYTHWEYAIDYYCEMQSHKKHWLWGWIKNHDDDINWGTGYGVSTSLGSMTHGTGWTQNSWQITYFRRLFSSTTPFSIPPNPSYQFTYNNTTLVNLDVSGLDCNDDCW